jgi:hypothetical protein
MILMLANIFYNIPNPYFYYFYLPLTAMSAVVLNDNLKQQYLSFIYAVIAICAMAVLLNLFIPTPIFYIPASFLIAWGLYSLAIDRYQSLLPLAPVILSLAAYSLNYTDLNYNREVMLRDISITSLATLIILASLMLFPLSYYYRCWARAFHHFVSQLIEDLEIKQEERDTVLLLRQEHHCGMMSLSNMMPKKSATFSILKINLLTQRLSLKYSKANRLFDEEIKAHKETLIRHLKVLLKNIYHHQPCFVEEEMDPTLVRLIKSWNRLCLIT